MRFPTLVCAAAAVLFSPSLRASPADFYKDKTVRIVVGTGPVGTYALYAQLMAEHMQRHMPGNPRFIMQTMPGAGGRVAANHAYNIAPKDGSSLLVVVQTYAVEQALGTQGIKYDAEKFPIIGRFSDNTPVAVGWTAAGVTSFETLRQREVLTGGAGPSSPTDIMPTLLNAIAGTRYKLISGYRGIDNLMVAMEQGEIQAMVASIASFQSVFSHALRDKKINFLVQFATKRHPDIPHIPTTGEVSLSPEGRAVANFLASGADIGRMVIAPPGVPADRIAALRGAFIAMVKDEVFLKDVAKRSLTINSLSVEELEAIVRETVSAPGPTVKRAREILGLP